MPIRPVSRRTDVAVGNHPLGIAPWTPLVARWLVPTCVLRCRSLAAFDLALFNLAIARHPPSHPDMAGFTGQIDEVNRLAASSPGFVWTPSDGELGDATEVFGHPFALPNISTWRSIEESWRFVYGGQHLQALSRRREWFELPVGPAYVLWWAPSGTRPDWTEAKARLEHLTSKGPTPHAFSFKTAFDASGRPVVVEKEAGQMARAVVSDQVSTFLTALPADRRREVERVRNEIRRQLPTGYEEVVSKNMLVYQVPLERYPDTYNGHPLWYVALASQKAYMSLYLMPVYGDQALARRLADGFRAASKNLDMGKSCLRFKTAEDLALDVIGEIVAAIPLDRWVEIAQAARRR